MTPEEEQVLVNLTSVIMEILPLMAFFILFNRICKSKKGEDDCWMITEVSYSDSRAASCFGVLGQNTLAL